MQSLLSKYRTEYRAYKRAKDRCTNFNHDKWKYYGGRGIKFLFRSFEDFITEIGPKPKGFELDRENNNGHYEPGNVRWVTRSLQMKNRRYDTEAMKQVQRKGGCASGLQHAKNKTGVCGRNATKMSIDGRKAGLIGIRKQPHEAKILGALISNHRRWHICRNVFNSNCKLCMKESI